MCGGVSVQTQTLLAVRPRHTHPTPEGPPSHTLTVTSGNTPLKLPEAHAETGVGVKAAPIQNTPTPLAELERGSWTNSVHAERAPLGEERWGIDHPTPHAWPPAPTAPQPTLEVGVTCLDLPSHPAVQEASSSTTIIIIIII